MARARRTLDRVTDSGAWFSWAVWTTCEADTIGEQMFEWSDTPNPYSESCRLDPGELAQSAVSKWQVESGVNCPPHRLGVLTLGKRLIDRPIPQPGQSHIRSP